MVQVRRPFSRAAYRTIISLTTGSPLGEDFTSGNLVALEPGLEESLLICGQKTRSLTPCVFH